MLLKYKSYLAVAILSMTALLATACAEPGPAPEPTVTGGLEDAKWVLESYGESADLRPVLAGTEITATFDRAEGQVHGSAGCNTYMGSYQADSSKLSVGPIVRTEIGCLEPEGIMEQEQQYLKTLQAAESYQIQDGRLRITSAAQLLVFGAREE